jgi:hypothetical protein
MKKLMVTGLLGCALAATAQTQQPTDRFVVEDGTSGSVTQQSAPTKLRGQGTTLLVPHTCSSNSCTRAVPSAANEGLLLARVTSYMLQLCLSTGSFAGGGAVDLWTYNPDAVTGKHWILQPVSLPLTDFAGKTGCVGWTLKNSFGPGWQLVARSNAVTTSAAAPTLTVTLSACLKTGCGVAP